MQQLKNHWAKTWFDSRLKSDSEHKLPPELKRLPIAKPEPTDAIISFSAFKSTDTKPKCRLITFVESGDFEALEVSADSDLILSDSPLGEWKALSPKSDLAAIADRLLFLPQFLPAIKDELEARQNILYIFSDEADTTHLKLLQGDKKAWKTLEITEKHRHDPSTLIHSISAASPKELIYLSPNPNEASFLRAVAANFDIKFSCTPTVPSSPLRFLDNSSLPPLEYLFLDPKGTQLRTLLRPAKELRLSGRNENYESIRVLIESKLGKEGIELTEPSANNLPTQHRLDSPYIQSNELRTLFTGVILEHWECFYFELEKLVILCLESGSKIKKERKDTIFHHFLSLAICTGIGARKNESVFEVLRQKDFCFCSYLSELKKTILTNAALRHHGYAHKLFALWLNALNETPELLEKEPTAIEELKPLIIAEQRDYSHSSLVSITRGQLLWIEDKSEESFDLIDKAYDSDESLKDGFCRLLPFAKNSQEAVSLVAKDLRSGRLQRSALLISANKKFGTSFLEELSKAIDQEDLQREQLKGVANALFVAASSEAKYDLYSSSPKRETRDLLQLFSFFLDREPNNQTGEVPYILIQLARRKTESEEEAISLAEKATDANALSQLTFIILIFGHQEQALRLLHRIPPQTEPFEFNVHFLRYALLALLEPCTENLETLSEVVRSKPKYLAPSQACSPWNQWLLLAALANRTHNLDTANQLSLIAERADPNWKFKTDWLNKLSGSLSQTPLPFPSNLSPNHASDT